MRDWTWLGMIDPRLTRRKRYSGRQTRTWLLARKEHFEVGGFRNFFLSERLDPFSYGSRPASRTVTTTFSGLSRVLWPSGVFSRDLSVRGAIKKNENVFPEKPRKLCDPEEGWRQERFISAMIARSFTDVHVYEGVCESLPLAPRSNVPASRWICKTRENLTFSYCHRG